MLSAVFALAVGGPSAAGILRRSQAASGTRARTAQTVSTLYRLTQGGHVTTILVVAKAPNKILLRTEYPWMHRVLYKGYDGHTVWQSTNLGDAGPLTGHEAQVVKMEAAQFNESGLNPQRWPTTVTKLPDVTVLGHSYYALQFDARGAAPLVRLYDTSTFKDSGEIEPDGTIDVCSERAQLHGEEYCRTTLLVRGGKVAGTDEQFPGPHQEVDDIQFEPPQTPHDATASWLLDRYREALGPYQGYAERGTLQMIDAYGKAHDASWAIAAKPPMTFSKTIFFPTGAWVESFDGIDGTIKNIDGRTTADSFARLYSYTYNHCMLDADTCGITVTRQPNQLIDGRVYYVLGARSKTDPSVWFSIGLDPRTFLPAFADFDAGRLVFSDYARTSGGVAYPRTCDEIDFNGDIKETVTAIF